MIDYEKEYDGILLYITNDPESAKFTFKEISMNLVQVSTVVGDKWASLLVSLEATHDHEFMKHIAKQLKKMAQNA